jgi:phosphoribosylformylglycinamidine (FGAM) synthase-like enzyme
VSLYNETHGEPVYPTPAIGMIGLIDDPGKRMTPGFKSPGHKIAILGKIYGDDKSLSGSEYLDRIHRAVAGDVRYPDLVLEKAIAGVLSECARQELFSSAQNVAIGGFGVAMAKCCIQGEAGARGARIALGSFHGFLEDSHRPDSVLFGESNSVVIVSFDKNNEHAITKLCTAKDVPFTIVGEVTADRLVIQRCGACEGVEIVNLGTEEMAEQWRNGISREMEV